MRCPEKVVFNPPKELEIEKKQSDESDLFDLLDMRSHDESKLERADTFELNPKTLNDELLKLGNQMPQRLASLPPIKQDTYSARHCESQKDLLQRDNNIDMDFFYKRNCT